MFVKRFKDLKNNTYKIVSGNFQTGGFAIDFYEPFQNDDDGNPLTHVLEGIWQGFDNVSIQQFPKNEVYLDRFHVWRPAEIASNADSNAD